MAGYLVIQYRTGDNADGHCEVVSGAEDGPTYRFSAEQAVNAATISAIGTSRGMPERAVTIALATALQESGLRNIHHGDRDSLGLFQQRPSQGWGSAAQIMDPAYAAGEFYEHLARVQDYTRLPLTVAAQRVQHSGYPQAYAKHETDATLLAAAFTGRAAATLTCHGGGDRAPGDPAKVRRALVHDFGNDVLAPAASTTSARAAATPLAPASPSGQAAATSTAPASAPSAARGGARRTVIVPVRAGGGSTGSARRRGWALAHWAVASTSSLGIERVVYGDREWSLDDSDEGWLPVDGGAGSSGAPGKSGQGAKAGSFGEVRITTTH